MSFAREQRSPDQDPERTADHDLGDRRDQRDHGDHDRAGEVIGPRHSAGARHEDGQAVHPPPGTLASSSIGDPPPAQTWRRPRAGRRPGRAKRGAPAARPGPLRAALGVLGELVTVLVMAIVLSLIIKTFLVQAFYIPSQSMETTLMTGDRVVVSKLTPGPFDLHRGDIVVFKDPGGWLTPVPPIEDAGVHRVVREAMTFVGLLPQDSGEHLIKRVIGLPGDTVRCCDEQGRVVVDGVGIDEPYLHQGDEPSEADFSVTVPAGQLWVMGDHRSVSKDSRYNSMQFVPVDDVVGKAFLTVWPLDRLGGLQVDPAVFAAVPAAGTP